MARERLRAAALGAAALLVLGLGLTVLGGVASATGTPDQCVTGAGPSCHLQPGPHAQQGTQTGMNASATAVSDTRFIVTVEGAGFARNATARVPFSIGKENAEGELRSVEVRSGNRTGEYTIGFDEADTAANLSAATGEDVPPMSGAETDLAYVAPDSDLREDAFDLTYNFDIDRDHLEFHQVSAEDATVAVYRDGEWESVPTEVEPDGGEVVVSASVSTHDPVALGLKHGNLSVVEVTADGPLVSNRTDGNDLLVRVRNDGSRERTGTFEVEGRNDWIMTEQEVTVPANDERTVAVPVAFNRSGTWPIEVGSHETTVEVIEPQPNIVATDLRVENDPIRAGEEVRVVATVRNDGREGGAATVPFRAFGEVVGTTEVQLEPGESRTVEFSQRIDAPGTYRVGVANRTATVDVEAADGETTTPTTDEPATSQAVSFWEDELGVWAAGAAVVLALLFGAATVSRVRGRN